MLSLFYIVQIPFCSFYIRTYSGVPFAPPYFVSVCGFARLRRANPQTLTKSCEAPITFCVVWVGGGSRRHPPIPHKTASEAPKALRGHRSDPNSYVKNYMM